MKTLQLDYFDKCVAVFDAVQTVFVQRIATLYASNLCEWKFSPLQVYVRRVSYVNVSLDETHNSCEHNRECEINIVKSELYDEAQKIGCL